MGNIPKVSSHQSNPNIPSQQVNPNIPSQQVNPNTQQGSIKKNKTPYYNYFGFYITYNFCPSIFSE